MQQQIATRVKYSLHYTTPNGKRIWYVLDDYTNRESALKEARLQKYENGCDVELRCDVTTTYEVIV